MTGTLSSTERSGLDLPELRTRTDAMYPPVRYRRAWTAPELLALLPDAGARVLDVGAGRRPLEVRSQDELVTVDFEPEAGAGMTANVAESWPFAEAEFDLIYMSHVLEHFYPRDRDAVIRHVHRSLRPGGLLFIRVPHRSSFQATGWEHYSYFGLNGIVGLCHGHNPELPVFRLVSAAASLSLDFYRPRGAARQLAERVLSRYWRLTDMLLAHLVGGIPEVQFLLLRLDAETEARLRLTSSEAYG